MKAGPEPITASSDESSSKCGCLTPLFRRIFDRNHNGKVELGEVVAVGADAAEPVITAIQNANKTSPTSVKWKKNKH